MVRVNKASLSGASSQLASVHRLMTPVQELVVCDAAALANIDKVDAQRVNGVRHHERNLDH
jgi:hypothetical protein